MSIPEKLGWFYAGCAVFYFLVLFAGYVTRGFVLANLKEVKIAGALVLIGAVPVMNLFLALYYAMVLQENLTRKYKPWG